MHTVFGPQFEATLRGDPGRVAMTLGAVRLTYGDLERAASDLAARLRQALPDAAAGSPVALLCPCPVANLIGFLAVQHAGFAHLPLNPRLTDPELTRLLAITGTRLVLGDEPRRLPAGIAFARVIPASATALPVFDLPAAGPGAVSSPPPQDTDIGLIISSSGSSGHPKCVRIRRDRYAHHIAAQARACDLRPSDIYQLVLPCFHGGGLIGVLGAAMVAGATVAALPPGPFVAAQVLDHLVARGVTMTHLIPTMLYRVAAELEARPRDLTGLRRIHFGSMPMDPELMTRCRRLFPGRMNQTYGSTECGLIGVLSPADIDAGSAASARILAGQGVRIVDAGGRDVAVGETGELVVARDLALIADYAGDPALTAAVIRGDLVYSGDMVRREAEGLFRFIGRKDAMIVSGGFKIVPSEVEACLGGYPGISAVAVLGVPDPEFGQAVCAVIEASEPACPPLDALRGWARTRLAPYKLPRRVVCVPALPRTATGKIAYAQLRALLAALPQP